MYYCNIVKHNIYQVIRDEEEWGKHEEYDELPISQTDEHPTAFHRTEA
jgi:hypothetical protein